MQNLYTSTLAERLEELESEYPTWLKEMDDEEKSLITESFGLTSDKMTDADWREAWEGTIDGEEHKKIEELKNELGRSFDDDVELIHENNFAEYARQLAEDIGAIDRNASWPCNYIDWEAAANSLMMDYSTVDFDRETYYYRE